MVRVQSSNGFISFYLFTIFIPINTDSFASRMSRPELLITNRALIVKQAHILDFN